MTHAGKPSAWLITAPWLSTAEPHVHAYNTSPPSAPATMPHTHQRAPQQQQQQQQPASAISTPLAHCPHPSLTCLSLHKESVAATATRYSPARPPSQTLCPPPPHTHTHMLHPSLSLLDALPPQPSSVQPRSNVAQPPRHIRTTPPPHAHSPGRCSTPHPRPLQPSSDQISTRLHHWAPPTTCQIKLDNRCQIMPGHARSCEIMPDRTRSCEIMPDHAGSCQIMPDPAGSSEDVCGRLLHRVAQPPAQHLERRLGGCSGAA